MFDVVIPIVLYQIGGLQLEGCSFDGSRLTDSHDSPSVVAIHGSNIIAVAILYMYYVYGT